MVDAGSSESPEGIASDVSKKLDKRGSRVRRSLCYTRRNIRQRSVSSSGSGPVIEKDGTE